jgi:hypothetical protein
MSGNKEPREILVNKNFLLQCESYVNRIDAKTGKVFAGVSGRLWPDGFYHLKAEFRDFDEKRDGGAEEVDFDVVFSKYGPNVPSVAAAVAAAASAMEIDADVVAASGQVKDMTIQPPSIQEAIAKPGAVFEDGSVMGEVKEVAKVEVKEDADAEAKEESVAEATSVPPAGE